MGSMADKGALLLDEEGRLHRGIPPRGEAVSAVGAEMCIRDRHHAARRQPLPEPAPALQGKIVIPPPGGRRNIPVAEMCIRDRPSPLKSAEECGTLKKSNGPDGLDTVA